MSTDLHLNISEWAFLQKQPTLYVERTSFSSILLDQELE